MTITDTDTGRTLDEFVEAGSDPDAYAEQLAQLETGELAAIYATLKIGLDHLNAAFGAVQNEATQRAFREGAIELPLGVGTLVPGSRKSKLKRDSRGLLGAIVAACRTVDPDTGEISHDVDTLMRHVSPKFGKAAYELTGTAEDEWFGEIGYVKAVTLEDGRSLR